MLSQHRTCQLGLLLLLAACGDEGGEGKPAVASASADGKVGKNDPEVLVSDLNDAEWKSACSDLGDVLSRTRGGGHSSCILQSLLSEIFGQSCMEVYDTCIETPPTSVECDDKPTDCDASLREVDACLVTQAEFIVKATEDLDCESSIEVFNDVKAESENQKRSAECQRVEDKCPSWDDKNGQ